MIYTNDLPSMYYAYSHEVNEEKEQHQKQQCEDHLTLLYSSVPRFLEKSKNKCYLSNMWLQIKLHGYVLRNFLRNF